MKPEDNIWGTDKEITRRWCIDRALSFASLITQDALICELEKLENNPTVVSPVIVLAKEIEAYITDNETK